MLVKFFGIMKLDFLSNIHNFFFFFSECNGAIISENIILTTAHCVKDPYQADSKKGDITVLLGDSASDETIKIVVDSFLIHPDYSNVTFENNLALLQLSEAITFNELIQPLASPILHKEDMKIIEENTKTAEEFKILQIFTAQLPIIHRLRKNSNFFTQKKLEKLEYS